MIIQGRLTVLKSTHKYLFLFLAHWNLLAGWIGCLIDWQT